MNVDPLREQLRALPDLPPPDALWPKLQNRQRQRTRRHRLLIGTGLVTCALAVGVLFSVRPPVSLRTPLPAVQTNAAAPTAEPVRSLQAVDHALQVAYARGASDDELAPLWNIRRQFASAATPNFPTVRGDIL